LHDPEARVIFAGNCRDVLGTARKLSKERDDIFREVGRLYDAMLELHNNMTMEIQVLSQENASLRRNGFRKQESERFVALITM
jgi:hypothetical protein